jgi:hypothetical protein
LISDSSGYVSIDLKAPGKYVIEGRSAGQTLFYDTLAVTDLKTAAPFTYRARALSAFKGKLRLASGMRVDSGSVFIRGTRCVAKLDDSGGYDLGSLPADVGRMAVGVRFSSSPTSVQQVTLSPQSVYTCKEVPKDSAARIAAPVPHPLIGAQDMAKPAPLDTGVVNPALKSCDSLPKGSVISVVSTTPGVSTKDSSSVLVVNRENTSLLGTVNPVVVPYAECVPSLGVEKTSFDVTVLPASAGSDLYVKDVADKCLSP